MTPIKTWLKNQDGGNNDINEDRIVEIIMSDLHGVNPTTTNNIIKRVINNLINNRSEAIDTLSERKKELEHNLKGQQDAKTFLKGLLSNING